MRTVKLLPILMTAFSGASLLAQGYLSPVESNKKVVFDFYRLVFEPRNPDLASQFIAEDFIEHNPRFQSGRDNFVKTLKSLPPASSDDISDTLRNPPAMIMAEGDLVTYIFKRNTPDPKDKSKTYETYWFDTFRIKDRKIVEHWDPATR